MTDPQQPRPVPPPAGYPTPPVPPAPYPQPSYPQPYAQPSYPQPGTPPLQAPPGAFEGPAGGYAAPMPAPARPQGTAALGRIALLLSLIATVALTAVGGYLAWQIGHGVGTTVDLTAIESQLGSENLAFLTPVRDFVLWAEITTWTATGLGVWALIQGIVAIARRRGRGSGIAAVIIAVAGPIIYFVVFYLALAIGLGFAAASSSLPS